MRSGVRDWILSVGASNGNLARGLNIMTYTSMFHFRTAADTVEVVLEGMQEFWERDRVLDAFLDCYRKRRFEAYAEPAALGKGRNSRR